MKKKKLKKEVDNIRKQADEMTLHLDKVVLPKWVNKKETINVTPIPGGREVEIIWDFDIITNPVS